MSLAADRSPSQKRSAAFERRVLAMALLMTLVTGALAVRLFNLTVLDGAEHRIVAESRLDRSTLLPTVRGTITDRKGRVLAHSVPSYDLALRYAAISGQWVQARAIQTARAEAGKGAWAAMGPEEREARIAEHASEHQRALNALMDAAAAEAGLPRAELDDRIGTIRTQVERKANVVWNRQLERERAVYGDDADEQFDAVPIREQTESHVVAMNLPTRAAFALRKMADATPGVLDVLDGTRREYPWSEVEFKLDRSTLPTPVRSHSPLSLTLHGVADHIVGGVREEVWTEDLDRRPYMDETGEGLPRLDLGGYRPGRDMIGSRGVERTYEDELRGARGRIVERLDTGEVQRTEAERGRDLQLTIDAALQARVQALFDPRVGLARAQQWHYGWYDDGTPKPMPLPFLTPLNGAVVVLDIESGEALVSFSWPTMAEGELMDRSERARSVPAVNRALETPYPPGSIIKPLVYVAAVRSKVFSADGTIACNGHFFGPDANYGRCWIYRPQFRYLTHSKQLNGPLTVRDAICRSCNIFFYTLAQRMGLELLCDWYRAFGMGQPLDTGVGRVERDEETGRVRIVGEHGGILPSEAQQKRILAERDEVTQVIAGIGQGPVAWTPMQAANAYATLARGGRIKDATLIRTPMASRPPRRTGDLELDPQSCQRALEGLRAAVEDRAGTGHHITVSPGGAQERVASIPGISVWAKSGTAQAPPQRFDVDGDGKLDAGSEVRNLEHGWFVGLVGEAGEARPRYAVAVVLEHGGSGGKSAGPIAAQVIRALMAEGYLRGGEGSASPQPASQREPEDIEPVEGAG
jgi:penicillin-binding protein 2